MTLKRNTGAPHRLGHYQRVFRDGAWVTDNMARPGDVFDATPREQMQLAYKLEDVEPQSLPADAEVPGTGPTPAGAQEDQAPGAEDVEAAASQAEEGKKDAEPQPGIAGGAEPSPVPPEPNKQEAAPEEGEDEEFVPLPDNPDALTEDDLEPYHTGYGWHTLPGGERVHGKASALERLKEIVSAYEG